MTKDFNMFDCFKVKKQEPGYGYGDTTPLTPGFIIPHTRRSPGATNYTDKYSEYQYGLDMGRILINHGLPYSTRDEAGVTRAAWDLADLKCTWSIEPHFNSFNGGVEGYEILVLKGDTLSEYYGRLVADYYGQTFPHKKARGDRGIKFVRPGDRGAQNLIDAKKAGMKAAILTELFFGDNAKDYISPTVQAQFWINTLVK